MRIQKLIVLGLMLLLASALMSLDVGVMYPIDMGSAYPAGVTSNGGKVAAYISPWGGVMYWTEAEGVVSVDTNAEAGAIADDGRIFGSKINAALGYELPCYWDASNVYHELPHLAYGQNSDQFFASIWSCNPAGTVLGGMQWISGGVTTPVIWYLDGLGVWHILDLMPGDTTHDGRVDAVSSDGTHVAGWMTDDFGIWVPTIWTIDASMNVSYEAAPAPPEGAYGSIQDFSPNGLYKAGYVNGRGALWNNDDTFELFEQDNASSWSNTTVVNVSNDALCVGRTIDFWNYTQWGFVFKPGMGYMRADDYFNMFGVTYPADYSSLDMVFWVSADESMMYGWYIDTNSTNKQFMLIMPEISHIEGTVTLDGTIGTVEGVLIQAGSTATHPDATGHYSLTIGEGTYNVTASLAGYVTDVIENVVVGAGTTVSNVNFTLHQLENAGFIEGNLTAISSFDPFISAVITATNGSGTYSTNGTSAANYQLIIPAGTYDILATQTDCFDVTYENVVVTAGEVTHLDIEFMSLYTPCYIHADIVVDDPLNFDYSIIKGMLGNNTQTQNFSFWDSVYDGPVGNPGVYTISAWAEGYKLWFEENATFTMNDTTFVTIVLEKNTYPVRDLAANNNGTVTWQEPMPQDAYFQDNEDFQTNLNVSANISYWTSTNYSGPTPITTDEMAFEGGKSLKIATTGGTPEDIYYDIWPNYEYILHKYNQC